MTNGDVIYGVAASSSYSELGNLHAGDVVNVNIVAEGHAGVATAYKKIAQQYVINEGEDHQYIIGLNLQQALNYP